MTDSVFNDIPYLPTNVVDPAAGINAALRIIDGLLQCKVEGLATAPPSEPTEGTRWLVDIGATGDWSGEDLQLAEYVDSGWTFRDAYYAVDLYGYLYTLHSDGWITTNLNISLDTLETDITDIQDSLSDLSFLFASSDNEGSFLYRSDSAWVKSSTGLLFEGEAECNSTTIELFRIPFPSGGAIVYDGIFVGEDGAGGCRWFHNRQGFVDISGTFTAVGTVASNNGQTGGYTTGWTWSIVQDGTDLVFYGTSGTDMVWKWKFSIAK